MAVNNLFTFYPNFNEFLPVYRDVVQVWVGDGANTGTAGMLYARYQDESVAEIGSVSLYETAVRNGFTGTPAEWVQAIAGVARLVKGSQITYSYQVSSDGVNHPNENSGWSSTPSYQQGQFTWVKVDLQWVDGTTTHLYFPTYQGLDGVVTSVNNEIGDVFLHGENLLIGPTSEQTIKEYVDDLKDYVDENDIPNVASQEDIDSLFSMALFSGAVFITGRRFEEGDSITLGIEAVTQGAPLPLEQTVTINPTGGSSWHYGFGMVMYGINDIPAGQSTVTYQYKIKELSHNLGAIDLDTTEHLVSITVIDMGNGTVKIEKSANYNALYFSLSYNALGRVTFSGSIKLNGRSMAAREFMVRIKEGNEVIADNISTGISAASGQSVPIIFPPINYTLDDIGTHTYTVEQTSVNGEGVTIDSTVYTVNLEVLDEIKDGVLEIDLDGSEQDIDFVNTYAASGTATFTGTKSVTHRVFSATDTCSVTVTGNGRLPSPATVSVNLTTGESSADFSFAPITYTLIDMQNALSGYDDTKVFTYTVTETANIPGVTGDGLQHTITVRVTDNKRGQLVTEVTYSDGNKVQIGGTYNATGSITIIGTKTLANRNFVSGDTMSVTLRSTNGGKLPYISTINVPLLVGQNRVNFSFLELTYELSDINYNASRTFSYIAEEATVITGATNDANVHSLDITVTDNYDGTLTVAPVYSDNGRFLFESVYNATGYLAIIGTKTLQNRNFSNTDTMSVTITANDGGKLPNPATISVPLSTSGNTANFNFAQIAYNVTDLAGLNTKVYNYTATESCNMPGASASSLTDPIIVTISDNYDGTLSVVPTYTSNNKVTFTNTYTATGNLSFKVREIITNGTLNTQSFTARITQVTGNNSTTQASNNVVLASPATVTTSSAASSQDLAFNNVVSFVKNSVRDDTINSYWFMIDQVVPTLDANNINNNVYYDTNKKWINVSVTDNGNGTLTVTKIPAADAVTELDMTFTNEQLGTLTITNTWTGDHATLTTAQKNAFTFNVSGPNGYNNTFAYSAMINDSKSFDHLVLGQYTVTETNNTIENYTITTSFAVNGTATNSATLVDGAAKTVAVTNNVNKLEGSLTISKTFTGSILTDAQKNAVTFILTGPKQVSTDASTYSNTFTFNDMTKNSGNTSGTYTINNLTLGTYSITETNNTIQGQNVTVAYVVDSVATNNAVVSDGETEIINVTNAYEPITADVTITTLFEGIQTNEVPSEFNITNDYNNTVFTLANADNAATADGVNIAYQWTISNVPYNTTISFEEHNFFVTGYDHDSADTYISVHVYDTDITDGFVNQYTVNSFGD